MKQLNGLVLAGGRSRRMGEDKALLQKGGESLLTRTMSLLQPFCDRCFVSVQSFHESGERANYEQIPDAFGGHGPVDGIASAQKHDAHAAWLVVACDLPMLDRGTIRHLLEHRSITHEVTAYVSSNDGLPEPLCAVYEPGSAAQIAKLLQQDMRCARKVVLRLNHHLINQPAPGALANANTPQQWQSLTTSESIS